MNPCANFTCSCSNPSSTMSWTACAAAWNRGNGHIPAAARVAIVNGVLSLVRRLDRALAAAHQ